MGFSQICVSFVRVISVINSKIVAWAFFGLCPMLMCFTVLRKLDTIATT